MTPSATSRTANLSGNICAGQKAQPEEAVYIGDTAYDMACAADAGVESALALWGCASPTEHIRADFYLAHPGEIPSVFVREEGSPERTADG